MYSCSDQSLRTTCKLQCGSSNTNPGYECRQLWSSVRGWRCRLPHLDNTSKGVGRGMMKGRRGPKASTKDMVAMAGTLPSTSLEAWLANSRPIASTAATDSATNTSWTCISHSQRLNPSQDLKAWRHKDREMLYMKLWEPLVTCVKQQR